MAEREFVVGKPLTAMPLSVMTEPKQPPRMAREKLKPGEVLCSYCTAKCCRYFALPIETPTEFADFEYIRWYLLHERATVFTEDDSWYLLVHTPCKHLRDDHLCGIYDTRPRICRDYTTEACEYDDDWTYERYFETPEQIQEYAEAVLQKPARDIRSPRPALLPIVP
ncbi:MAG: YkgJ family cysteine cluster protein [Pirellulaceae bacterium]